MKYLTRKEELMLLTILHLGEDSCLLSIQDFLNRQTDMKWSIGNVYVALDRLSKAGYLECFVGAPLARRGGKGVKYYRPTDEGLKALVKIKKVQDSLWQSLRNIIPEK